jgi:hypothetical protein
MPLMQAMAERANAALTSRRITRFSATRRARLGTTGPVDRFLQDLGIVQTGAELTYLQGWPEGLKEILRAAIRSAINRTPPLPVTFSWAPGYDYELNIWEATGTATSPGGMTILMRSRYPADTHPAQARGRRASPRAASATRRRGGSRAR